MTISDATRIRVIRAMLGMDSKSFAARLGVTTNTMTNWEKGRSSPVTEKKQALAELCLEEGIGFLPSGMPFPIIDAMIFKEFKQENQNA